MFLRTFIGAMVANVVCTALTYACFANAETPRMVVTAVKNICG